MMQSVGRLQMPKLPNWPTMQSLSLSNRVKVVLPTDAGLLQ